MNGARCDDHVGEDHPPRCSLCESLQADYAFLNIEPPRVEQDYARVESLGSESQWAACGRCNYDGPLHYGVDARTLALSDLEQHTARHRNISTHPNTTSRST